MPSKFIKWLSVLILSFQLLSEEFTFFNSYDAETDEGLVGLRLFGKNDKFIGLNCSPGDSFDGPLLWFSLGQSVKSSSLGASMFYKFDNKEKVVFSVWPLEVDGEIYLTLVDTNESDYGTQEFLWIENFMQELQKAETLTVGLTKSISETKFSNISGREDLEKFFEVASTIDSCYLRTAEEEARQIRVAAEAEAERKRQEAAAAAEKARKEEERYAEFRSDVSQIIKDNFLLFFGQPIQEVENNYYSTYKRNREDGLCWGAELYQFILNEEGNEYESASVLPSESFNRRGAGYNSFNKTYNEPNFWALQISASMSLEKFTSMTLRYSKYNGEDSEFESYYCADLSEIRSSYDFDDFKTEEYQNVRSIIKDEWSWSPRNSYDPAEVASFFNKLSFTLVIGGFKVDEQFEKLSNGFYQKWGESEFIEKLDGRSITDRTIWFKKKSGGSVPIVLKFSLDPYTYDVAGAIRFDEEDFDWSLWLD